MRSEASSIENIIFEDTDTLKETLKKVVLINCGSTELKKELKNKPLFRININFGKKIKNSRKIKK